jgi:hypothetical protein
MLVSLRWSEILFVVSFYKHLAPKEREPVSRTLCGWSAVFMRDRTAAADADRIL